MPADDALEIMSVVPYVRSFFDLMAIKSLGLNIDANSFSFDKLIMWAWIKEYLDGRKT
jgi:hypothetical protein